MTLARKIIYENEKNIGGQRKSIIEPLKFTDHMKLPEGKGYIQA